MISIFELREYFTMPMAANPEGYLSALQAIDKIKADIESIKDIKKTKESRKSIVINVNLKEDYTNALDSLERNCGVKDTEITKPGQFDILYHFKLVEYFNQNPNGTKGKFIAETIKFIDSWAIDETKTAPIYQLAREYKEYIYGLADGSLQEPSEYKYSIAYVFPMDYERRNELFETICNIYLEKLCAEDGLFGDAEMREIFDTPLYTDRVCEGLEEVFFNHDYYTCKGGEYWYTNGIIDDQQLHLFFYTLQHNSNFIEALNDIYTEVLYTLFKSKPQAEIEEFITSVSFQINEIRSFDNSSDPFAEVINRGFEKVVENLKLYIGTLPKAIPKPLGIDQRIKPDITTTEAEGGQGAKNTLAPLLCENGKLLLPYIISNYSNLSGKGSAKTLTYLLFALAAPHIDGIKKSYVDLGNVELYNALKETLKYGSSYTALNTAIKTTPLFKMKEKIEKIEEALSAELESIRGY